MLFSRTLVALQIAAIASLSAIAGGCSDPPPKEPACDATLLVGVDASFEETLTVANWQSLRDSHGVRFAFLKATQGTRIRDQEFAIDWQGTQAAKILRGAYHYYIFSQSPEAQAEAFVSRVQQLEAQHGKAELPPVVDVEDQENPGIVSGQIPAETAIGDLKKWLELVEKKLGKKPIVYSYPFFWQKDMKNSSALTDYPLWMAYYPEGKTESPQLSQLRAEKRYPHRAFFGNWKTWKFWQYSSVGYFDGLTGPRGRIRFDLNTYNGSMKDLLDFAGMPVADRKPFCDK